jgi:hypothetical protein
MITRQMQSESTPLSLTEKVTERLQQRLGLRIKLIYSPETIGTIITYCYGHLKELDRKNKDSDRSHITRYYCGLCDKMKIVSIVLPEQFEHIYQIYYSAQKDLWLIYHQCPALAHGIDNDPVLTTRFSRTIRNRIRKYDYETRYVGYFEYKKEKCILKPLYSHHPDRNLCRALQKQSIDFTQSTPLSAHAYDLSKGFIIVGSEGLVYFNCHNPLIFFASVLRPFPYESSNQRIIALEILADIIPDTIVQFLKPAGKIAEDPVFLPNACEEFIDELAEIFQIMSINHDHYRTLRRTYPDVGYFRLLDWFSGYYRLEPHCDSRPIDRYEICEYMTRSGFTFGDELTMLTKNALIDRSRFMEISSPFLDSFQNKNLELLSQCLTSLDRMMQ